MMSGMLLLMASVAVAVFVSGAVGMAAVAAGARGRAVNIVVATTVLVLFVAVAVYLFVHFARLIRGGAVRIPGRWLAACMLALPVLAPLWGLTFSRWVERRTDSEAFRVTTDETVMYLLLTLVVPVSVGVPVALMRLRPQVCRVRTTDRIATCSGTGTALA
jgi:hypothetical protein